MSESTSTHAEVEPLLGPMALGVLEPAERGLVSSHVQTCPACAQELASLTEVADRLGELTEEQAGALPSPHLADQVVVAMGRERRTRRRRNAVLAVAAGAVALTVAAGLGAAVGGDDAPAGPPVTAIAVRSTGGVDASAGYVAHTWGVEIKLAATGFVPGGAYDVGVVDRQGRESAAGAFVGTGERRMSCNLNSGVLARDAASFVVRDAAGVEVVRGTL